MNLVELIRIHTQLMDQELPSNKQNDLKELKQPKLIFKKQKELNTCRSNYSKNNTPPSYVMLKAL